MTETEVIKALECCEVGKDKCRKCPFYCTVPACSRYLAQFALDLINRQQAEIEKLQKENERFADIGKMYSEVRAEVIKEFANRLTDKADLIKANAFESRLAIWQDDIDNLVKEMTEVSENG